MIEGRNPGTHPCIDQVPREVTTPFPNQRPGVRWGGRISEAGRCHRAERSGAGGGGGVVVVRARGTRWPGKGWERKEGSGGFQRRDTTRGGEAPPGGGAATRVPLSGLPPVAAPL